MTRALVGPAVVGFKIQKQYILNIYAINRTSKITDQTTRKPSRSLLH